MSDAFKEFGEKIMAISPGYMNVFGMGIPGNVGASAMVQGTTTPQADLTYRLKKATARLVNVAEHGPAETLPALANEIEGLLLAEETFEILTDKEVKNLINELHSLVEK